MEKGASGATLRYSRWTNGTWSEPETVVADDVELDQDGVPRARDACGLKKHMIRFTEDALDEIVVVLQDAVPWRRAPVPSANPVAKFDSLLIGGIQT